METLGHCLAIVVVGKVTFMMAKFLSQGKVVRLHTVIAST